MSHSPLTMLICTHINSDLRDKSKHVYFLFVYLLLHQLPKGFYELFGNKEQRRILLMLWCTLRLSEVCSDVYKNTCGASTLFLSAGPSSLLPNHHGMKRHCGCFVVAGGLVRTLSRTSDEAFPKETQTGETFFIFYLPFHKLVFLPTLPLSLPLCLENFCFRSCFDIFVCCSALKRFSNKGSSSDVWLTTW